MIIATETTRFAARGRDSPRGRNAETPLRLIDAVHPFGDPGPGRTTKGIG
jgi:hypothetical protein